LFLLPVVLGLIGVAYLFDDRPFPVNRASQVWGTVHGVSLLLGTVVVILGFIAGVMYLVQSYRLKHKLPPSDRFKLPSLEWLETTINRSIAISTLLLAAGVLSGVILNVAIRVGRGASGLGWNDPVVWTSGLLFGWLMAAWIFSALYRPARQGRKVAYLTFATFGFLVLTLAVVLWAPSDHPASVQVNADCGMRNAELIATLTPHSAFPIPHLRAASFSNSISVDPLGGSV
ncbi:MAG: cytochrome c biogenesis protein CcsA, partial [Pirellulales bacterium]